MNSNDRPYPKVLKLSHNFITNNFTKKIIVKSLNPCQAFLSPKKIYVKHYIKNQLKCSQKKEEAKIIVNKYHALIFRKKKKRQLLVF